MRAGRRTVHSLQARARSGAEAQHREGCKGGSALLATPHATALDAALDTALDAEPEANRKWRPR